LCRERRRHQGNPAGRCAGRKYPGLALEIPHKEPLDTRNKQRVFAAFERLIREEKAPEAKAQMPEPESLHFGRAHV
jgi:hypothetical protein